MNMNRQSKRMMAKQGDQSRAGMQQPGTERSSPREFLSEVRAELRKVAWPTKQEVITSTIVVLMAVVILTTLIGFYDYGTTKLVNFLYS